MLANPVIVLNAVSVEALVNPVVVSAAVPAIPNIKLKTLRPSALDEGPCVHGHNAAACMGFGFGLTSLVTGALGAAAAAAPAGSWLASTADGLSVFSLMFGIAQTVVDATTGFANTFTSTAADTTTGFTNASTLTAFNTMTGFTSASMLCGS